MRCDENLSGHGRSKSRVCKIVQKNLSHFSIHLKRYNNGRVKKAIKLSGNQNIRLS